MWKLLLLSTLCLQVHATIYFQQIGWMSPSPSYGHIHFSIDTNIIAQHASNLRILIGSVRKMVHTIPHESTQKRADRFLLRAHLDIEEIIKDFSDFKMIISDTQPDQKRSKRFLELLLGIGSLTLSLFNQAEIMHLQGSISTLATQQSHIVDILQEHEVAIHSLRHDISKIRDGFLTIINITQENYAATKLHDIELEIIMALTELRRTVTCVQHGLERLLSHRVPICFLNSTKINESIKNLNNKAQPYKLESISKHIPGFLQYETSFLLINEQIHIFVHVPLINFDSQLNLLRFNNAPLQITQSYSIQMALTEDVIAINKHGQHSVISQTELTRYNKYGEYFMGNTPVSLHTQINQTCLGSIYSQTFKVPRSDARSNSQNQKNPYSTSRQTNTFFLLKNHRQFKSPAPRQLHTWQYTKKRGLPSRQGVKSKQLLHQPLWVTISTQIKTSLHGPSIGIFLTRC